jgi:hypothetical protein
MRLAGENPTNYRTAGFEADEIREQDFAAPIEVNPKCKAAIFQKQENSCFCVIYRR